jgi:hypothetical protein
MTRTFTIVTRIARCPLIAALFIPFACAPAKPTVIAVMRNPGTGEQVEMYRENPLKVPAGYDETKHIAEWKADQRARGFTDDLSPR